jgi:hypothetical protein
MASTQPVSFTSPGFDYSADVASIDRKRKLAEALQAQSFQPIQAATANGIQTPVSWTQGLAKLAEAWASGKQEKAADKEQRELAEKPRTTTRTCSRLACRSCKARRYPRMRLGTSRRPSP